MSEHVPGIVRKLMESSCVDEDDVSLSNEFTQAVWTSLQKFPKTLERMTKAANGDLQDLATEIRAFHISTLQKVDWNAVAADLVEQYG